jgi:hypothetical protein
MGIAFRIVHRKSSSVGTNYHDVNAEYSGLGGDGISIRAWRRLTKTATGLSHVRSLKKRAAGKAEVREYWRPFPFYSDRCRLCVGFFMLHTLAIIVLILSLCGS